MCNFAPRPPTANNSGENSKNSDKCGEMEDTRNNTDNGDGNGITLPDPALMIGDIGLSLGDDIDIDLGGIGRVDIDDTEATRYTLPRVAHMRADRVCYSNAAELARHLRTDFGMRADCFVSGDFIFGDFIEAFMVEHQSVARHMTVATLSLSQDNVDSLHNLLRHGYVQQLDLVVSTYFWAHERRSLVPYTVERLDIDDRFQLAVADIHTKTVHFDTLGGRKIVIHGSANLRSSGNIEQFTIEENPGLHDFYDEHYKRIVEKYATIRKAIRNADAWETFTRKLFND